MPNIFTTYEICFLLDMDLDLFLQFGHIRVRSARFGLFILVGEDQWELRRNLID